MILDSGGYLRPLVGKQVRLVLNNETMDGRVSRVDLEHEIVTLAGSMGGEPYTIYVRQEFIQAIVVQEEEA